MLSKPWTVKDFQKEVEFLKMNNLTKAIDKMNSLPDVHLADSPELTAFCERTTREIASVGSISAATGLEMVGYMRQLEEQRRSIGLESITVAAKLKKRGAHIDSIYELLHIPKDEDISAIHAEIIRLRSIIPA